MTESSLQEKELIDNIQHGDISSFEFLFKKNYRNLCLYAESIVKEQGAAEEIVGDFFLNLWENREKIVIKGSINSYFFSSIHNNSIKYLEHLKVLRKYHDYASYMLRNRNLLESLSPNYPLANLISKEIINEIEEAILALPEQCREIFNLSRFEELSYEEIATKLNLSINTVRTQMTRALSKLRISLKEYLPILIAILTIFLNQ